MFILPALSQVLSTAQSELYQFFVVDRDHVTARACGDGRREGPDLLRECEILSTWDLRPSGLCMLPSPPCSWLIVRGKREIRHCFSVAAVLGPNPGPLHLEAGAVFSVMPSCGARELLSPLTNATRAS